MSAAFVLMITDGQDTQKRAEDLQVAGYAVVQAWRRRAAIVGLSVMASSPFQYMCLANHSSIGSGRRWNSRYPSQRHVVPWIHSSFLSATGMLSNIVCTSLGSVSTSSCT
jgi:hypothetical protein